MIKNSLLSFLVFLCLNLSAQEKTNYKIELKIKGLEDSVLYLANYYGDKTFLVDTAKRKGKNNYVFEKKKNLKGGIYIVVGPSKNSIFEFLISDSQNLKFDSDMENLIEQMKVKGSNENSIFFRYLSYSNIQFKRLKDYQSRLEKYSTLSDSLVKLKKQIKLLNQDVGDYKEAIIEAYPKSFIAHFFLAMKNPPEADLSHASKQDSLKAYQDFKRNYWNYMDFDDDRLIRTPVFHNKLNYYFSSLVPPLADSIETAIDQFLKRMPEKSELYKHSLWTLTLKFDQINRMGFDAILVYLADNYYAKGKAYWLNSNVLHNILDEAKKRRSALIGKTAPNLVMQDSLGSPISMYNIDKKYTLIYFWNPNCSHCQIETPKLLEFYNDNAKKFDLEIYAVCADTNMQEMKAYIKKNNLNWINVNGPRSYTQDFHELYNVYSTPYIFLLNRNKKIIAKQIRSKQLLNFILDYEKHKPQNE
jgi:thiol-disulfide isomerase/thioredoxin